MAEEIKEADVPIWTPLEDEDDWQLAEWLVKNVGQNSIDEFLKLPVVSVKSSSYNVGVEFTRGRPPREQNPPTTISDRS
jgi:hypothetical protein